MRLIDADKLKTSLNKTVDALIKRSENCLGEIEYHRFGATIMAFNDCVSSVNEQPTVDAVAVVRCKDCNKASKCYGDVIMRSRSGGNIYCPLEFCSHGERREDAAEGHEG